MCAVLSVLALLLSFATGFVPLGITTSGLRNECCSGIPFLGGRAITAARAVSTSSSEGSDAPSNSTVQTAEVATVASSSSAPVLNGKRVLPFKVLAGGLKGHKVAAVYAVINSNYKRG
jgi:hypothetical protein